MTQPVEMTVAEIVARLEAMLKGIDHDAVERVLPLMTTSLAYGTEDVDGTCYWMDAAISIRLNNDSKPYRSREERDKIQQEAAS